MQPCGENSAPKLFLTVAEAAWLLQESEDTIIRMCREGLLEHRHPAKSIHVCIDDVARRLTFDVARRALDALLAGSIKAPRAPRKHARPPALTVTTR